MGRRLLVVADSFYPTVGGAERVIAETSRALRRRGHEVWIVAGTGDRSLPGEEEVDGVHIRRYRFSGRNVLRLNMTAIASAARVVHRVLAYHGPFDLVHSHNVMAPTGAILCPAARALPRVSTFHGPADQEFRQAQAVNHSSHRWFRRVLDPGFVLVYARWLRFLQARVLRSGPCVILSRFAADLVREVAPGYPGDQLRLVPGGVDLERFRPATNREGTRRALGLPSDGPVLLTARRFVGGMGLEHLLDAMSEVTSRYPGVRLVVGGAGPLESALRQRVLERGLTATVTFPGLLRDDVLPRYYQAADLFILPSVRREPFGLVTLEALACGTPVLATRVGGSVEILEPLGEEFLVEATPSHLAKGIVHVLERWNGSPTLRERCRAFVEERYSWDLAAARLERVYDELLLPWKGSRG